MRVHASTGMLVPSMATCDGGTCFSFIVLPSKTGDQKDNRRASNLIFGIFTGCMRHAVPYYDGHTIFVHKPLAGLGYWDAHGFFVVPESLQPPA